MVLVQKRPFFQVLFLANIGHENVLYDFLERKNAFLGYKTRSSKSRKIDIFPEGLAHGFSRKMTIFPIFFLGNIGQENVFYNILEQENAFLGYRKGLTHGFCRKMAIFPLFLRQNRPGKCFLRYSATKRRLSRLKNKKFKK